MALFQIHNVYYNGQLTTSPDQQRPAVSPSLNILPPHQWRILNTGQPNTVSIQFYDANGPTNERGYLTLNPDGPRSGGMEVLLRPALGESDLQLWSLDQVAAGQYKFCSTQFLGLCLAAGRGGGGVQTLPPMIPVSAVPDGDESGQNMWRIIAAST